MEETLEYAREVAQDDPYDRCMIKLAVNRAQDVQEFTSCLHSTHSMYPLIRAGEWDPAYAIKAPKGAAGRWFRWHGTDTARREGRPRTT